MGSFGERLRREREMRGIGLDEIAEATKIGSRSLRALEDENFQQLPGGIFNKGFVRAYARYLGIDAEQAVSDYLAAEASYQNSGTAPPLAAEPAPRRSLFAPVVIAIAITVLLLSGWRWWRSKTTAEPAPSAHAVPARAQPRAVPAPPASVPATAPAANPKAAAANSSAAEGAFVVLVRAREQSWISAASDNGAAAEYTLPAGAEKSFRARDRLVLKVGNLPGVEISHNGKPIELAAGDKVRTLTFTAQGLQP